MDFRFVTRIARQKERLLNSRGVAPLFGHHDLAKMVAMSHCSPRSAVFDLVAGRWVGGGSGLGRGVFDAIICGDEAQAGWVIGVTSGAHDRARLLQAPHAHLLSNVAEIPAMLGGSLAKE